MADLCLTSVFVRSMSLVIPVRDFDHLPRQLGCSLHRRRTHLELGAERPGCSLLFEILGERAALAAISVHDDLDGRFMRDVAALVVAYRGDLEATLEWNPAREEPMLRILRGETNHPLLSERSHEPQLFVDEADVTFEVERWLDIARQAWREYRGRSGPIEPDRR